MNKKRLIVIGIIAGICLVVVFWHKSRVEIDSGHRLIMGTFARVVAVAADSNTAKSCIKAAFEQLHSTENLMSYHKDDSQISKINRDAYKGPVKVSKPTFEVLQKALEISRLSDGAFDITVGPLVDLYRSAAEANSVPSDNELAQARSKVGYKKLILDVNEMSVRFAVDGMKLDLGGIAKGYAIDKAVEAMQNAGAIGAMVDVGGDIRCFGTPPQGKDHWLIGLQDPTVGPDTIIPLKLVLSEAEGAGSSTDKLLLVLKLENTAIATSGDYRRFVLIGGKKYSHIIDTKTGCSSDELTSVTIISQNATVADALATAVSVMGAEKGLALIDAEPNTEAILVRERMDESKSESANTLTEYELIKTSGAKNFVE